MIHAPRSIVVALLLACGVTHAADDTTPRGAVEVYLRALYARDAAALDQVTVGDAALRNVLAGQLDYIAAEADFRAALVVAFPPAAAELPDPAASIDEWVKTAQVSARGDRASVTLADSVQRLDLRRDAGRWKIDLASMYPADALPDLVRFRTAIVKSMKSLTADVKAKKIATFDDVKRELDTRVKVQLALPPEEPATQPAP